jgi:hypothetical protein
MLRLELQRRQGQRGPDKNPTALTRVHQTQGLEARHRFSHHGAADLKVFGQTGFRGQFGTRLQTALLDFGTQLRSHLNG